MIENGKAEINIIEEESKISEEIKKTKINITKEEFLENLKEIINEIKIGQSYEYIGDDYNLLIKPTNSTFLQNSSHVNFVRCENTLREILKISSSRILTFLQMEINNKNEQSLVNRVEYQVYDDNKSLLDLTLCNDSNIGVFYSIKNNSKIDIKSVSSFKEKGIDIFNINDSFFHDICKPYSNSKNDIILKERIKDIYQNYSICDEGCIYNQINTEYMTIECDCKIKTNLTINETSLNLNQYEDIKTESNFGLIKCYN